MSLPGPKDQVHKMRSYGSRQMRAYIPVPYHIYFYYMSIDFKDFKGRFCTYKATISMHMCDTRGYGTLSDLAKKGEYFKR